MLKKIPYPYLIEGYLSSHLLSKFFSYFNFKGIHSKLEKLIGFCFLFTKKFNQIPFCIFFEAAERIKPLVGLNLRRKFKKGGVIKAISTPQPLSLEGQFKKSLSWLASSVKISKDTYFSNKLFTELLNICFFSSGGSFIKRSEYYGYAIAYKASKNFKW